MIYSKCSLGYLIWGVKVKTPQRATAKTLEFSFFILHSSLNTDFNVLSRDLSFLYSK